jgi:arginase
MSWGPSRQSYKEVETIGVPVDFGGNRRGVGLAPTAFRLAGLLEKLRAEGIPVRDGGDIPVGADDPRGRGQNYGGFRPLFSRIASRVQEALDARRLPVVVGGDHSVAIGTLAGVAGHFRRLKKRLGVLWIDAHGDMNTPATSPSGNIHGMPLAIALGEGPRPLVRMGGFAPKIEATRTALIGVRNLDALEKENMARFGVQVFTMKDIDRRGLATVMEEALHVASQGADGLHVSFDVDVVDPSVAPGVGTPVPGGMSYREAHLAMELVHDSGMLASLEVVEANPILDIANSTARLGTELILSALGKSIY